MSALYRHLCVLLLQKAAGLRLSMWASLRPRGPSCPCPPPAHGSTMTRPPQRRCRLRSCGLHSRPDMLSSPWRTLHRSPSPRHSHLLPSPLLTFSLIPCCYRSAHRLCCVVVFIAIELALCYDAQLSVSVTLRWPPTVEFVEIAACIHTGGLATLSGPAIACFPLGDFSGVIVNVTEADVEALLGGLTYVSIATAAYPAGECHVLL